MQRKMTTVFTTRKSPFIQRITLSTVTRGENTRGGKYLRGIHSGIVTNSMYKKSWHLPMREKEESSFGAENQKDQLNSMSRWPPLSQPMQPPSGLTPSTVPVAALGFVSGEQLSRS